MYQTHKTFIEINDHLYLILRTIKESHNPIIDSWKEVLMADKVFKKDGNFIFVREVPEAEIINEDTIDEQKPIEDEK